MIMRIPLTAPPALPRFARQGSGRATLSFIAISLLAIACNRGESAKLPPARGDGAPPPAKLPQIDVKGDGKVAPTEGRTTGTTFPHREAQLGPNAGGILSDVAVDEGSLVKKGQVLFRQDQRDAQLRVEQATQALAAAQLGLRTIEIEYERSKQLFDQNALNRAQWEQVEARRDSAKIGVEQAQVGLRMMQKALEDCVVRAPFDGVVTQKLKNAGEMITTVPVTVVVILQDQSTLDLRFRLPERALATVKEGDMVSAKFDSLGVEREARIIRVVPSVDARTRTVEVVATLDNPELTLRPGLLAEVLIK
jgi:RND family efflux transporter MFP subunit